MPYPDYVRYTAHVPSAPVAPVQFYYALFYFLWYPHRFLPDNYAFAAYPPPMCPRAYSPAFPEHPGADTCGFLF
jgi:hypothetical protein